MYENGFGIMLYRCKEEIHNEIRVNYLLSEAVQSNKYYKSGVTSEVGLPTNRGFFSTDCA